MRKSEPLLRWPARAARPIRKQVMLFQFAEHTLTLAIAQYCRQPRSRCCHRRLTTVPGGTKNFSILVTVLALTTNRSAAVRSLMPSIKTAAGPARRSALILSAPCRLRWEIQRPQFCPSAAKQIGRFSERSQAFRYCLLPAPISIVLRL